MSLTTSRSSNAREQNNKNKQAISGQIKDNRAPPCSEFTGLAIEFDWKSGRRDNGSKALFGKAGLDVQGWEVGR